MPKFLKFILLACLLAACVRLKKGTEQPHPTQPLPTDALPTASASWTSITFTQSGGLIGMMKTTEITSDGAFTIHDERVQTTVTGNLSAEQLAQLNLLVAPLSRLSPPHSSGTCMDCFIYDIEISASGKSIRLQADDVSLPNSGLIPLVNFIHSIEVPATP